MIPDTDHVGICFHWFHENLNIKLFRTPHFFKHYIFSPFQGFVLRHRRFCRGVVYCDMIWRKIFALVAKRYSTDTVWKFRNFSAIQTLFEIMLRVATDEQKFKLSDLDRSVLIKSEEHLEKSFCFIEKFFREISVETYYVKTCKKTLKFRQN